MRFIDMHCDTLMNVLFEDPEKMDLYQAPYAAIDFLRMKEAGQMGQFFAAFMPVERMWQRAKGPMLSDEDYIRTTHDALVRNVEAHDDLIRMAYSGEDAERNWEDGRMSAFFTMEDGRAVQGDLGNIKRFYDMGCRALALTWNAKNCFGSPNSTDSEIMAEGLTDFGKDGVRYMQEIGMLVDVSHLSEGGFWDVAEICTKPFIASHSNSRALSPHQRNLSDDQIRALADKGGVTGINFCPAFLNEDITCKDSTAERMADHVMHIIDVGGIECVGLGSDLDGTSGNMEIDECSKMHLLEEALRRRGLSEDDLSRIFYRNVLRVLKEAVL